MHDDCPICGGVGAVLAVPVVAAQHIPVARDSYVDEDVTVLIPCPWKGAVTISG